MGIIWMMSTRRISGDSHGGWIGYDVVDLLSFLLAVLANPRALERALDDVDLVHGVQRSPTMDDMEKLPHIQRLCFPAGTIFFANTWAIHHDETEYDNPGMFNPDRWLGGNTYGTKTPDNNTPGRPTETEQRRTSYDWGAGRRICSEREMAEASLKITIAKMGWACNLQSDEEDEEAVGGLDVSVETGYEEVSWFVRREREFEALKGFYENLAV
ncbi:cytochrome P450 [Aspergillus californicus]